MTTVLQSEPGRTVVLEDGGSTVKKTFHGDDRAALQALAAHEFDRMNRFASALEGIPRATCPTALEVDADPEPYVRMTRAMGVPLQRYLGTTIVRTPEHRRLAETLRAALVRYVDTFAEPYWDFILRNMFYEPRSELVTFLDFGVPTLYLPALDQLTRRPPLDVSAGALVASAIFEAGRPKRMWNRWEHHQAFVLARLVLDELVQAPGDHVISRDGVRGVVDVTYGLAARDGGAGRRLWYRLAGAVLARPMSRANRVLHPSPLGRRERAGRS